MERAPLPDPVARRARRYLAALVPADEVSDAWHELVADVTYWGDREELPVLRLAHQVVLQHQRVTAEAAVLALREAEVATPDDVAEVLDVPVGEAEALVERVAASVGAAEHPDVHVFDAEVGAVGTRPADEAPDAEAVPVPTAVDEAPATPPATAEPVAPSSTEAAPDRSDGAAPAETPVVVVDDDAPAAVRIGFEDDDVIDVGQWEETGAAGLTTRQWAGIAAIVLVAALLLWLLLG